MHTSSVDHLSQQAGRHPSAPARPTTSNADMLLPLINSPHFPYVTSEEPEPGRSQRKKKLHVVPLLIARARTRAGSIFQPPGDPDDAIENSLLTAARLDRLPIYPYIHPYIHTPAAN